MDNVRPAAVAIISQWCSWLFAFVWTRIGGELLGRWAADPGPRLGDAAGNARLGAGATLRCAERVRRAVGADLCVRPFGKATLQTKI